MGGIFASDVRRGSGSGGNRVNPVWRPHYRETVDRKLELSPERLTESSVGTALDPGIRREMETTFDHDFSEVRIHSDHRANESARMMDARAYTVGTHIVFGAGQYPPRNKRGWQLLAHELIHVSQQEAVAREETPSRLDDSRGSLEKEAAAESARAIFGKTRPVRERAGRRLVQRDNGTVDVDLEAVTPERERELSRLGIQLPRTSAAAADPRAHTDYVDRRMTQVGYGIYLGGFFVYCEGVDLPIFVSNSFLDQDLTQASPVSPAIFPDYPSASAHIPYGPWAPGQPRPYAYHRVPSTSIIVPTLFSAATTPRTMATLAAAQRELARTVQHELSILAISMLGGAAIGFLLRRFARVGRGGRERPVADPLTQVRARAQELVRARRARGDEVIVNIGGAGASHEPANAINLNNQVVPRRGIRDLVEADGAEIGNIFSPGSIDRIEGHRMAPRAVDWSRAAPGAYRVLRPGGTFRYSYQGGTPDSAVLAQMLRDAGFRNVEVISETLVLAVK